MDGCDGPGGEDGERRGMGFRWSRRSTIEMGRGERYAEAGEGRRFTKEYLENVIKRALLALVATIRKGW